MLYVQFAVAQQVCSCHPFHSINTLIDERDSADLPISYPQKKPQFWYSTIQGMIGKLYVLSLYYIMYDDTTLLYLGQPTLTSPPHRIQK